MYTQGDRDTVVERLKSFNNFKGLGSSAFLELYRGANDRIKAYLRCVIEKSYILFVLHHDNFGAELRNEVQRTKSDLTRSDLEYIASISSNVYGSDNNKKIDKILHGTKEGMETCIDTLDSIIQDWEIPKRPLEVSDAERPIALDKWLIEKREQYKGFVVEKPIYSLKYAYTTFLFDNQWYQVSGYTFGIDLYAFECISDEISKSLDRIGARYIVYHGDID